MKKLILLIGLALNVLITYSQITFEKTYGEVVNTNIGNCVHQTIDGGFIIVGERQTNEDQSDVYLIKTDENGDVIWTKYFGEEGNLDYGSSVQQTNDSGYIITGSTGFGNSSEIFLIKTNQTGDSIWTKTFIDSEGAVGSAVQQTNDGGYIISGTTKIANESSTSCLIKTNEVGDTLWTREYVAGVMGNVCYSVQQTEDGGYIMAGVISDEYYSNGYLIKTNENGDTLWTKYNGLSLFSVKQLTDGGYIATGTSLAWGGPGQVLITKTNSDGDFLWTNTIGNVGLRIGRSIHQNIDGGFIIAGNDMDSTGMVPCLVKTSDTGDSLWMKTYSGFGNGIGNSVLQTTDGGYAFTGYSGPYIYLVKTDNDGLVTWTNEVYFEPGKLKIYPNPSKGLATITYELNQKELITMSILNIRGQEVKQISLGKVEKGQIDLDCSKFSSGIYFINLQTANGILTEKLIIE